eukprot:2797077-Rhodomonas_salina.1
MTSLQHAHLSLVQPPRFARAAFAKRPHDSDGNVGGHAGRASRLKIEVHMHVSALLVVEALVHCPKNVGCLLEGAAPLEPAITQQRIRRVRCIHHKNA